MIYLKLFLCYFNLNHFHNVTSKLYLKLDNARRGKALTAMKTIENQDTKGNPRGNNPRLSSFSGGGCCGGAHYIEPSLNVNTFINSTTAQEGNISKLYNYDHLMPLHRNIHVFSALTTPNAIAHNTIAESNYNENPSNKTSFDE